ncbi:MAG: glucose 1-dehydrogenase [Candidatus Hydrogenedentes bacterium]|nr:glucose 1-dehydrogenase [Candidatus Hydrogenedentota bacterium]
MHFENKSILVTGGAQGIGMAVSMAFARAGARVVFCDVDEEAGAEHLAMLRGVREDALFVPADVGKPEDVYRVVAAAGTIDVLVNNAGINDVQPMEDRSIETWDRVLAVNLRSAYLCARAAAPAMPEGGAIVNIASTRAFMSEADTESYSASKGGIIALTHSLAISLAPKRIRVNAISPGWIDVSSYKKSGVRNQEALRPIDHHQHPCGRVGRPEDIAEACLFLADSSRAGFITGQNLTVDGGMTVKMIYAE